MLCVSFDFFARARISSEPPVLYRFIPQPLSFIPSTTYLASRPFRSALRPLDDPFADEKLCNHPFVFQLSIRTGLSASPALIGTSSLTVGTCRSRSFEST